ncbi:PREDICTED: uncharacterized protein LOC109151316 [Ipomoea nil]|uniref:uncharacterized protein LOC109151316 n=1 Tax=Ipomoea nil TaxID=35883 RepID=UPI0009018A28|nr:PREDICTED: uncharacterized protein LOC109151316 [Ipomoea nil]
MALLNPKAVEWLSERSPRHYCRAFFNTFIKCDMLLNNLCESYNSSILNARDKPILTMLESLRIHLMTRMQANRDKMRSHPFKICPKIMKIIKENKDKATEMRVYKSIGGLFQIEDGNVKLFKVDLSKHICSCRRWDLTGIPCSHAISAVWWEGGSPEDYTHHCYTVESYLSTYEHAIMPITSSEMWPKTGLPPPLPPKYKAQPGRPKKLRKRDKAEKETSKSTTKLRKKGQKKRCSVCGKTGHNKSTCNKNKTPTTSSSQQVQQQIHRDENSITMVDEQ